MRNINSIKHPGKWISILYRGFISFLKREGHYPGLGYGQIPILMGLSNIEGISQDELAREISIDRTTLNRTIRPLIKEGFVQSQPNPQDRRANVVNLTAKGREMLPQLQGLLNEWNQSMLMGVTEEEQRIFTALIIKASRNISEINKP
nr:MarR family transcriptional regulator [Spirochaetaceae bacterium]